METLASVGVVFWSVFRSPLMDICLYNAQGSQFWTEKWILCETNPTNKEFLKAYLATDAMHLLSFMQHELVRNNIETYTTKWEELRLFAVLETVNNGNKFGKSVLRGVITPSMAMKLGMAKDIGVLVGVFNRWSEALDQWWEAVITKQQRVFTVEKETKAVPKK